MEKNDNKEINLLELIEILINWIKNVVIKAASFVGNLIQLLYRHLVITLAIILIAVSVGVYLSRPEARIYKAEALGIIYGSDAQTIKEISRQLENASSIDQQISFGKKLNLPDSIAKNIVSFNSYYVIEYIKEHTAVKIDYANGLPEKDTMYVKMHDRVYFQLKVKKINQVPAIEKAILNYFNTSELLQTHFQNARNQISDQIKISRKELARIDSLAKINYFKDNNEQLRFDKNKLLVGEQQKQLFYNDLLRLQDIISVSESTLRNFKQPIDIPSGFVVNPAPVNGTFKYSVISIFIGLIISLVVSGLLENTKKLIDFLKRKD